MNREEIGIPLPTAEEIERQFEDERKREVNATIKAEIVDVTSPAHVL